MPTVAQSTEKQKKYLHGGGVSVRNKQDQKPLVCHAKKFREGMGLSLSDVALHVHCSSAQLAAVENGVSPNLRDAIKLASFYGKTLDQVWPTEIKL